MNTALKIDEYLEEAGYSNHKSNLYRVLAQAPYLARCSDNKTSCYIKPREHALKQPYVQVNQKSMVSWLVFDIDDKSGDKAKRIFPQFYWEAAGLPEPNMVVSNRDSCGCHLFYAISPVCTSDKARVAPQNYLKAIFRAMGNKIGNDPAFTPFGLRVVKTPGHPMWKTWDIHNHTYNLDELAEYLELENIVPFQTSRQVEYTNEDSRHCLLFDEVRWHAYSIVREFKSNSTIDNFEKALLSFAEEKNTFRQRGFSGDLSASQVRATVKSVCTWTWNKYTGSGRIRGVMKLSNQKHLSQREKQQKSARRTAYVRRNKTYAKLKKIVRSLKKKGVKLTCVLISKISGLSRQTVSKYKGILEESNLGKDSNHEGSNMKPHNVNFGTHQITKLVKIDVDVVVMREQNKNLRKKCKKRFRIFEELLMGEVNIKLVTLCGGERNKGIA